MNKSRKRKGFTLVEIMIVIALIGLLASIAIPNYIKVRQIARTSACVNNMRVVDAAIDQWAMENGKTEGDSADTSGTGILVYIKGGALPTCPIGNADYIIGSVGDVPQVQCPNANDTTHKAQIK